MTAPDGPWAKTVFRARGLPSRILASSEVADLLSAAFGDVASSSIRVFSVVTSLHYWERSPPKVATVMITGPSDPKLLRIQKNGDGSPKTEWELPVAGNLQPLILDTHFLGMTPLAEPGPSSHKADCIAVSGLASHPFGSWQPKNSDKTFMWLRDELPKTLPAVRPIIYGYDSRLEGSQSFQLIPDIASSLAKQLQSYGWTFPSAKPLLFLGHSLGGLIVQEAMVQLANSPNQLDTGLLGRVMGAGFFGVPNLGMDQLHFRTLVGGSPNESLVEDLARNSNYLRRLESSFSGIALIRKMKFFWAYETEMTPTTIRDTNGRLSRTGPPAILVTRQSATRRFVDTNPASTFPIQADHSGMVKFVRDSPDCHTVLHELLATFPQLHTQTLTYDLEMAPSSTEDTESRGPDFLQVALESLMTQNLRSRVDQIEDKFDHTFEWIFHHEQFTDWLQFGSGIFWIRGKPASGKSTLMKFICSDQRTHQLLHDWTQEGKEIHAAFYFHFRGTALQKSFEGLLRSVVHQVLSQQPSLYCIMELSALEAYQERPYLGKSQFWTVEELERALRKVLAQNIKPLSLILFFDALDEFDGHPNVIGRFLRSLVNDRPGSQTRVKVLFSSRPWETLIRQFGDCPSLSIHEYTEDDIRQFSYGILSQESAATSLVWKLIPDIVERSQGVFLWVKLVIQDLLRVLESGKGREASDLRQHLYSLPTALGEYYGHIVDRIPDFLRWEAFVILETLVRAKSQIGVRDLVGSVTMATCRTYAECLNKERKLGCSLDNWAAVDRMAREMCGRSTGCMVEINADHVQLMHQTVYEYVTSLEFKRRLLGPVGNAVSENGYAFLLKYRLFDAKLEVMERSIMELAYDAEASTGHGMKGFIDSIPQVHGGWTALEFAVKCSLHVYLSHSRSQLEKTTEPLLSYLCDAYSLDSLHLGDESRGMETIRVLLQHGYRMERDQLILSKIERGIRGGSSNPFALKLFKFIFQMVKEHPPATRQTLFGLDSAAFDAFAQSLLRSSPPNLVAWLLEKGLDGNWVDSHGRTHLDWGLSNESGDSKKRAHLCCVLVEHGVIAGMTTKQEWRAALAELKMSGVNIASLQRHFAEKFPPAAGWKVSEVLWSYLSP
ncbi:hypothetical protein B0T16DRAFT_453620 [Cercophora newfieldiana]|uniref:Nephrocystin 3-like N-terminal domain-containing protein n=1 Tax=Cercophora newfieldiana TaxID=92897 RepID=A0AA39YED8_9PEZI|nr:hypothetical protein B0T16DRAFT_453620 [Cercophora newfieldiana]